MESTVRAVFRNGVFVPTTECDLPENTEVQVLVQGATIAPPREREPAVIDRGRGPEIAGTRITVFDVMDYLKHDWHRDRIAMLFRLSSRDVQAAIDYITAHREEVDAEYQRILDRHHNYRYPAEVQAKLDKSHEKFIAFVKELRSRQAQGGAMPRILADHNVEGHLQALIHYFSAPEWADVWASLACQIDSFEELGVRHETIDTELWQLCQEQGIVLIAGNRNADGPTSLETAIRHLRTDKSLPVVTISDPDRLLRDRDYVQAAAVRLLEHLWDLENLRGTGRLYIP